MRAAIIAKITIAAPTAIPAMAPTPMAFVVVVEGSVFDEELDCGGPVPDEELSCRGTLLMAVPEADVAAAPPEVRDSELTVTVMGPAVAPRVMPRLE